MLPSESEGTNNSSNAAEGKSSLPISLHPTDPNNFEFLRYFVCFLHGKKCVGGNSVKFPQPCLNTCLLGRNQDFAMISLHLANCNLEHCGVGYCKEAERLYDHWLQCHTEYCHLCGPVVEILIGNFTAYLSRRGEEYSAMSERLKTLNYWELRTLLTSYF